MCCTVTPESRCDSSLSQTISWALRCRRLLRSFKVSHRKQKCSSDSEVPNPSRLLSQPPKPDRYQKCNGPISKTLRLFSALLTFLTVIRLVLFARQPHSTIPCSLKSLCYLLMYDCCYRAMYKRVFYSWVKTRLVDQRTYSRGNQSGWHCASNMLCFSLSKPSNDVEGLWPLEY